MVGVDWFVFFACAIVFSGTVASRQMVFTSVCAVTFNPALLSLLPRDNNDDQKPIRYRAENNTP